MAATLVERDNPNTRQSFTRPSNVLADEPGQRRIFQPTELALALAGAAMAS